MTRIFPILAAASLLLFAVAFGMGLSIGDIYRNPDASAFAWRGRHMLTGTAAALGVVFVESIAVTYFIGTSRWCREVTDAYQLDRGDLVVSARLKRRTFPWCTLGMIAVVVVGALGAASDPGTGRPNAADTAQYHLGGALLGMALVAWTYFKAWTAIVENQQVIGRIVAEVQRIRAERGLDTLDERLGESA